jgi:hypothetical protein
VLMIVGGLSHFELFIISCKSSTCPIFFAANYQANFEGNLIIALNS